MKLNFKFVTIFLIFILGLYYYIYIENVYESMSNRIKSNCPDMLVEKDGEYLLYNSKLALVVLILLNLIV